MDAFLLYPSDLAIQIFSLLDTEEKLPYLEQIWNWKNKSIKYVTLDCLPEVFPELESWYFDYFFKFYHLNRKACIISKKIESLKDVIKRQIICSFTNRKLSCSFKDDITYDRGGLSVLTSDYTIYAPHPHSLIYNLSELNKYLSVFPYQVCKTKERFSYRKNNIGKTGRKERIIWDCDDEIKDINIAKFERFKSFNITFHNIKSLIHLFSYEWINEMWEGYLEIIEDPDNPFQMTYTKDNMAEFLLLFKK